MCVGESRFSQSMHKRFIATRDASVTTMNDTGPHNPTHTTGWTGGQFSLARYVFGTALAVLLIARAVEGMRLFPQRLAAAVDDVPAWWHGLPDVVSWIDHAALPMVVLLVGALMSFFIAAGNSRRPAALTALVVVGCLIMGPTPVLDPRVWPVCVVLAALIFIPPAPYGSIAARGRDDPAGGWRMPVWIVIALWVALGAIYATDGIVKVTDTAWRSGATLTDRMPSLPQGLAVTLAWAAIIVQSAFVPLALWRVTRPWIWLVAMLQVGRLLAGGAWEPVVAIVSLHLFTFDPRWFNPKVDDEPWLLFYDGQCGLCHNAVRFVMAEDPGGHLFHYAPLQGELIKEKIDEQTRATLPDSIVLITRDGQLLTRSSAVARMLDRLGGLWRLTAWALWLFPRPVRDLGYRSVARVRRLVFKQPKDACPIMPPELRARFHM